MKNRTKTGLIVFSLLAGCSQASQETAMPKADIEAIEFLMRQEIAAVAAADVEAQVALRTDNVLEMPPDESPFIGIEAYRKWSNDDPFSTQITAAAMDEIKVLGDWAYARFSYAWTLTPVSGGESFEGSSKGMWIVERQPDGSWKIAREIWNNNIPLDTAP